MWLWIVNSYEVQLAAAHRRRVIKLWTQQRQLWSQEWNVSLSYFLMQVCVNMQACVVCKVYQSRFIQNSLWTVSAQMVYTPRKTDLLNPGNAPGTPSPYGKPWLCNVSLLFASGESSRFLFFKVCLKIINPRKGWSALLFMFMQMQRCFRKPSRSPCEQLWHIKFKKMW